MTTSASTTKNEKTNGSQNDNQKGIENHKKAAKHLEEAAMHHHSAAKYHESGDHEKAAISTIKAHGELCLANDAHREDVKHHALYI